MARTTTFTLLAAFLALGLSITARAADLDPTAPSVALGSDYFATVPGTHFNFGGTIGDVSLMGLPIGPFDTDTIVQRQADAIIGGPAISIQIVALSLKSTAPVFVGGNFFDVFVTLDPANLANDTGSLAVTGTQAGGLFTSNLNVFFDAHFAQVGGGAVFDVFNNISLTNSGAPWGPTPTPGALLVNGPDDGTTSDQNANFHSGLKSGACTPTAPSTPCEVDFFLNSGPSGGNPNQPFVEGNGTNEAHFAIEAQTPEPASLFLIGSALLALGLRLKLRRA
jgi:hypothetical protein